MPGFWAARDTHGRTGRTCPRGLGEPPAERAGSIARLSGRGSRRAAAPTWWAGGLFRSLGGWAEVRAIRQQADRVLAEERILGTGPLVERLLAPGNARQQTQRVRGQRLREAQALIHRQCRQAQLGLEELQLGSRRRRIAAVRARLAVHLVTQPGLSLADTARQLGLSSSGIAKAVARAERPHVQ